MKVSSLLKGGICEVSFGYNSRMEVYTTPMSDIPELSEIVSEALAMKASIDGETGEKVITGERTMVKEKCKVR